MIFVFGIALFCLTATPALAAKKRNWAKATVTSTASSGKLSVSAKFTGWKQYLDISFKGLGSTKGVNYDLIYASNGVDRGGGGMVDASVGNVTRKVFLGSCSHAVCTADKNISNVRLSVTYMTTSGQSVTKNYKVKY